MLIVTVTECRLLFSLFANSIRASKVPVKRGTMAARRPRLLSGSTLELQYGCG